MSLTRQIAIFITVLFSVAVDATGQNEKSVPSCTDKTFAALKSLPKLKYECPEGPTDSDDKILRLPARRSAIRGLIQELSGFTNADWWQASVDELNACKTHGSAGELTGEEKEGWKSGNYSFDLFGNNGMRLALITDPCYQTGFNGSNAFLLYRKDGQVFIAQVLNGYYSRGDNSVGMDFAKLNGQLLVEVSTANSIPPSMVYHYFVIDPLTNKALPKKIFKDGNKFANQIYSAMLLAEPKDVGLPANASELNVIVNGHLAPSFSAYEVDERGRIDADGRRLRRIVYRWNGRFYQRAR
jgi:hypothetical protein